MEELRAWLIAAGIDRGRIFRRVTKMGRILGEGLTEKAVWHIVKDSAKRVGLEKLAPHDLRRTCARLCHASGGELEQIQFLLGHVSIQTTERYLGCKQRIRSAVNDRIGIEPGRNAPPVWECSSMARTRVVGWDYENDDAYEPERLGLPNHGWIFLKGRISTPEWVVLSEEGENSNGDVRRHFVLKH
jgi:Phage integrase family